MGRNHAKATHHWIHLDSDSCPDSLTLVTQFAKAEIFDQETYLKSVGPIAASESVQNSVSAFVIGAMDKEAVQLAESGPAGAKAATAYENNRDEIVAAIDSAVSSSQFIVVWTQLNETTHAVVVRLLQGKENAVAQIKDGKIWLDLTSVYTLVRTELDKLGIDELEQFQIAPERLQMSIMNADKIEDAQTYANWLYNGSTLILIVTIVLTIVFLFMVRRKVRALIWLAMAALIGCAGIWFGLDFARSKSVESISADGTQSAAVEIYDAVVGPMHELLRSVSFTVVGITVIAVVIFMFRRPARA